MPSLLKGLQETQWRSKQASILLLGAMAYCAPAQLSSCLPQIVPKLCECFSDTHPKVQAAAKDSLSVSDLTALALILEWFASLWSCCFVDSGPQDIASVIRNPEISAIGPALLGALANPTDNTKTALDTLSTTAFVHSIDAPSLALIVPVLRYAVRCPLAPSTSCEALTCLCRRGLHDRSTGVKMSACTIIGNMCSLVGDPQVGSCVHRPPSVCLC
jgi:hypothetical protein